MGVFTLLPPFSGTNNGFKQLSFMYWSHWKALFSPAAWTNWKHHFSTTMGFMIFQMGFSPLTPPRWSPHTPETRADWICICSATYSTTHTVAVVASVGDDTALGKLKKAREKRGSMGFRQYISMSVKWFVSHFSARAIKIYLLTKNWELPNNDSII